MKKCFGFFIFLFCVGSVFGMEKGIKCDSCSGSHETVTKSLPCGHFLCWRCQKYPTWGEEDDSLGIHPCLLSTKHKPHGITDFYTRKNRENYLFNCSDCEALCLKYKKVGKKFLRRYFGFVKRGYWYWDVSNMVGETVSSGRFVKHAFRTVRHIKIKSLEDFNIEFLCYLYEKTLIRSITCADAFDERRCRRKLELLKKYKIPVWVEASDVVYYCGEKMTRKKYGERLERKNEEKKAKTEDEKMVDYVSREAEGVNCCKSVVVGSDSEEKDQYVLYERTKEEEAEYQETQRRVDRSRREWLGGGPFESVSSRFREGKTYSDETDSDETDSDDSCIIQ